MIMIITVFKSQSPVVFQSTHASILYIVMYNAPKDTIKNFLGWRVETMA